MQPLYQIVLQYLYLWAGTSKVKHCFRVVLLTVYFLVYYRQRYLCVMLQLLVSRQSSFIWIPQQSHEKIQLKGEGRKGRKRNLSANGIISSLCLCGDPQSQKIVKFCYIWSATMYRDTFWSWWRCIEKRIIFVAWQCSWWKRLYLYGTICNCYCNW